MAGEEISDWVYALGYDEQIFLGRTLEGFVFTDLRLGTDLSCSRHSVLSNPDLGDGRYQYLFYFQGEEDQQDIVSDRINQAVAANGERVIGYVKSEFPELRRVEFEVRDGNVLAVVCTLDEMVDSLEMSGEERVGNLARLTVGELEERGREIEQALLVKGQKLVDGFGVDGVVCESVELDGKEFRCVVSCGELPEGYDRGGRVRAVLVDRNYDERGSSSVGGNIKVTFYVEKDVLDGPEVEKVAGGVAEGVAKATA